MKRRIHDRICSRRGRSRGVLALLLAGALVTLGYAGASAVTPGIYGAVSPGDYLTGRFNPLKHSLFVPLSSLGIPVRAGEQYLRREAAEALRKMFIALEKDYPGIEFWVQSSVRNWYDQKIIWENKWTGVTLIEGRKLNESFKDPLKRARKIMEYSSMPGASRHHWGTDLDINALNNRYYESGEGAMLYAWLRKNASRFGFCQPYTAGRSTGYEEERWHWSYRPLACRFLAEWESLFVNDPRLLLKKETFAGAEAAAELAPLYVKSINPECRCARED